MSVKQQGINEGRFCVVGDGAGAKVTWQDETHYVLLDTKVHAVNADGIKGEASVFVAKERDGKRTLSVPLDEKVRYRKAKRERVRDFAVVGD